MKNKDVKAIIKQIRKYNLSQFFKTEREFNDWLANLDTLQISNFLSLDISPEKIKHNPQLLIYGDLLKCQDYLQRVETIIRNEALLLSLFSSVFLSHPKFYEDLELIEEAMKHGNSVFVFSLLEKEYFLNSPYHTEDLRLIANAKRDKTALALSKIAINENSVQSPYHKIDMELVSKANSRCILALQDLATNNVSLNDKYHLENMQIIQDYFDKAAALYYLMTSEEVVSHKTYRLAVTTLLNAPNKLKLYALLYYIARPYGYISDWDDDEGINIEESLSVIENNMGLNDPKYLENINKISGMEDDLIIPYLRIITQTFIRKSPYREFDLSLLETIEDKNIFKDFVVVANENFMFSPHHIEDIQLICKTADAKIRSLLITYAVKCAKVPNPEHEIYINSLANLTSVSKEVMGKIKETLNNIRPDNIESKKTLAKLLLGDSESFLDKLEKCLEIEDPESEYAKKDFLQDDIARLNESCGIKRTRKQSK